MRDIEWSDHPLKLRAFLNIGSLVLMILIDGDLSLGLLDWRHVAFLLPLLGLGELSLPVLHGHLESIGSVDERSLGSRLFARLLLGSFLVVFCGKRTVLALDGLW